MKTFTFALTLALTFTLFMFTMGCSRREPVKAGSAETTTSPADPDQTIVPAETTTNPANPEQTSVPEETAEIEVPTSTEIPAAELEQSEQTFTENMKSMVEFATLDPLLWEKFPAPKVREDVRERLRTQTAYTYSGEVLIYAEHVLYLFNIEKRIWIEGQKSEFESLLALIPLPDQSALLISPKGIQLYNFERNELHEISGEKCGSALNYSDRLSFKLVGSKLLVTAHNGKESKYEAFDIERDCFGPIEEKELEKLLKEEALSLEAAH